MKYHLVILSAASLIASVASIPIPQICSANARLLVRSPQSPPSVATILATDPCLPPSYNPPAAPPKPQGTNATAQGWFSNWLHSLWDKIRNALKHINIKINIPWSVLEGWLDKLGQAWSIIQDPNNDQGVELVPPPGVQAQALHWAPALVTEPVVKPNPGDECGGPTAPGRPVRECP